VRSGPGAPAGGCFFDRRPCRNQHAKEAAVKGVGGGLSIVLQSFETAPTPGRITPVDNCSADPRLNGWFVYALPRADETLHVAMALRHPAVPTIRELDATLIP
jgi:hypothetical protein